MSYKAAWERINSMNNLASQPLLERTTGGRGGGGSTLTPYAHELIATFERFDELHREFINRFKEAGDNPQKLAKILSGTFLSTSARNQIPSTISKIENIALNAKLYLDIDNIEIVAIITQKSLVSMGLEISSDVYMIVKSSDIHISVDESEENRVIATIKSINTLENSTELSLELSNKTLFMMVDERLEYQLGDKIAISINPKNIIIGI